MSVSSDVCVDGISYRSGLILSAGYLSGMPEFFKIVKCVVVQGNISFLCQKVTSWYTEHLRSYIIEENRYGEVCILDPDMLNDFHPLVAYTVGGCGVVTPKAFLLH